MKTGMMLLIATTAATCALADASDAVTKAANSPSKIPEAIAELEGVSAAAFASDVIEAIAAMPKSPVTKLGKMVAASSELISEAEDGKLADMIVALVSNVPFEALPEWTTQTIPAVQKVTADMEEAAYQKLVSDVVKKIGSVKGFSNDDKTVVTAFAIKLLARGADVGIEDEPIVTALKAVPGAYKKQVTEAMPATLAGDYAPLLGGIEIITLPTVEAAPADNGASRVPVVPTTDVSTKLTKGAEAIAIHTAPAAPAPAPKPASATPAPSPVQPSKPKPPVPKPYAEQF